MTDEKEEQHRELVEMLQTCLDDALAGTVTGVAIVRLHSEYQDGTHVGGGWAGAHKDDLFRLVGGLEWLKGRVLEDINSDDETDEDDDE